MIDREDVEQALEIAAGSAIGGDLSRRTASQHTIDRQRQAVLRFLRELPGEVTIEEIREALDEQ